MGQKKTPEEIMTKIFPHLMINRFKNLRDVSKIAVKKTMPRHITIKLKKIKSCKQTEENNT